MGEEQSHQESEGHKTTFVVSSDSGMVLGNVNRVFIDTETKKVSGLSFRRKFLGK